MERYSYSPQERAVLEKLQQPFAVYQFIDRRVVTLILSDGFCRLFGYEDREQAMYDMDHDMYKDAHPDDVARIASAAVRFATTMRAAPASASGNSAPRAAPPAPSSNTRAPASAHPCATRSRTVQPPQVGTLVSSPAASP